MFKAAKLLREFHKLPEKYRNIVFFSEGPGYWNTLSPMVIELENRGIPFTYLSMDENDPGLNREKENCPGFYLGQGSGFNYFTSMMKAGVVVMTTPGLQTLNLKRSPGVKHYIHVVHSPTGMAFYRKYSFDHFDTVMCSGPHQITEIRKLEQVRHSKAKQLLKTGCLYMDALKNQAQTDHRDTDKITVLVAPTWGPNGALQRFGSNLITSLLDAGFKVILRPHPQQYRSEKKLLFNIRKTLTSREHIIWDDNHSGHQSMADADIMISDLSGVIFDFAFVYMKPVITLDYKLDTRGFEYEDLKGPIWEKEISKSLGAVFTESKIDNLHLLVNSIYLKKDWKTV
ncbi:MAG: CDP-glycerol glycerophosphotransferase family protein, partial [Spirochaetaceae bacterium]|nr:CDP-glycerol glycerophosphotransferase family protein [Spirochaetaceae bacterium]